MSFRDQVQHALELRADLVDFVAGPRFAGVLETRFDAVRPYLTSDFDAWEQAVDELIFSGPDDGTPTLLERYLSTRKNLADADRDVLELWRDAAVYGLFQVHAREEEILDLRSLLDDLDYETYAAGGADAVRTAVRGSYLQARLLPVGPAWITSGQLQGFPSRDRIAVGSRVARLLHFDPAAAHRNPANVEKARALLRAHHDIFVSLFGADVVSGTGEDTAARYSGFLASEAEPAAGIAPFPKELRGAADVAMFHHPVTGLGFVQGFGAVEAALGDDTLAPARDAGRSVLAQWLDDDTVPPTVLAALVVDDPGAADELYRDLLDRPDFTWEAGGDALLRERKAAWFDPDRVPALAVLPQIALDAVQEQKRESRSAERRP